MALKVGEIFVNLGIKGADKATDALKDVRKNMNTVVDSGLAAKAAIIGVIYGMEKLMSSSAQTGTALSNFEALTGISAQTLQKWQFAARQVGVSADEMTGAFKGVQNAMTNMLLGKGAPEGLAMIANTVGFDIKRARDTAYVMEQLQKASRVLPKDMFQQIAKSFNLSEGVIAAMNKQAFRPEILSRAPTYSEKEVNRLNQVDVAWKNLGASIEMAFGHLTSKRGLNFVKELQTTIQPLMQLLLALDQLAEKVKIFQAIGEALKGWAGIFGVAGTAVGALTGNAKDQGKVKDTLKTLPAFAWSLLTAKGKPYVPPPESAADKEWDRKFIGGARGAIGAGGHPMGHTYHVQQTNHITGVKGAHEATQHIKKAVNDTLRQLPAQGQAN